MRMGTKQLPHEHMFSLDQEEAVVEEIQGNRDELQRTRRNLETLMRIWGTRRQVLTDADRLRRGVAVLWFVQGDATAKGEDDSVLSSGGGARAAEGRERRKTMERRRMRKDWSWLFIRKDS